MWRNLEFCLDIIRPKYNFQIGLGGRGWLGGRSKNPKQIGHHLWMFPKDSANMIKQLCLHFYFFTITEMDYNYSHPKSWIFFTYKDTFKTMMYHSFLSSAIVIRWGLLSSLFYLRIWGFLTSFNVYFMITIISSSAMQTISILVPYFPILILKLIQFSLKIDQI